MNLKTTITLTLIALLGATGGAFAQTPGAIDQVNSVQQRQSLQPSVPGQYQTGDSVPEIYPGESSDVGPQSVVTIKPRRTWVEGIADSQYFHTDNVFLDHNFNQSAGVLVSTAQIALAPTAYGLFGGQFAPRLGFRQQWYDFFQDHNHPVNFGNYDYNDQTIFTDVRWMRDNWIVGAGFDYNRLMSTHNYSQFYAEYVPEWEVQRSFPFCEKHNITLAYQGYYHFTDTSASVFRQPQDSFYDRLDQCFLATYNYAPCSHALLQPYYSFKYTHFTRTISRDDYLNSVGLAGYWFMCRYCSLRAFVSYDNRKSTLALAEYHQFSPGAGLNIDLRF